jgi:hypothetical protein
MKNASGKLGEEKGRKKLICLLAQDQQTKQIKPQSLQPSLASVPVQANLAIII